MKSSGRLHCLAIALATGFLVSCSPAGNVAGPATKEGFADTDDGVRIHYWLLGPSDAPTLWVGYLWTDG